MKPKIVYRMYETGDFARCVTPGWLLTDEIRLVALPETASYSITYDPLVLTALMESLPFRLVQRNR